MADTAICYIQGKVQKVEEGSSGWTHFHIDVGRDYAVKLSTKKEDLIAAARAVRDSGEVGSWKYQLSLGNENPHRPGERYKNRRLEAVKQGLHGEVTQREPELDGDTSPPRSTPKPTDSGGGGGDSQQYTQNDLHPNSVLRIEESGRRKAWSIAIGQATTQLQHTFRSEEALDDQWKRILERATAIVRMTSGEWAFDRAPEYLPEALRPDPSAPRQPENSGGRDNADEPVYDDLGPPLSDHDDQIPF
jgi:hypothetical protein